MFLLYSEITHGSGNGVVQGWDGPALDFRFSNVFEDVVGYHVTQPRKENTQCPEVVPACK
jgi:hypothetical protein